MSLIFCANEIYDMNEIYEMNETCETLKSETYETLRNETCEATNDASFYGNETCVMTEGRSVSYLLLRVKGIWGRKEKALSLNVCFLHLLRKDFCWEELYLLRADSVRLLAGPC